MTPPLDADSWVRLPVPLSGLQEVSGSLENETFSPANTITIPADLDLNDPSALFKGLPLEDADELTTDQVFSKPIEPYLLRPDSALRSTTKLRVYVYPYSLDAGRPEAELQTLAVVQAEAYGVPVTHATTRVVAETIASDEAPAAPEDLLLVDGSAAPVLGSGELADLAALEQFQVAFWAPTAGSWDDEEGVAFNLNDWLTLGGVTYSKGLLTTNGYLAFPETANVTYNVSLTSPAYPKLLVAGGDYEARVLAIQYGTNYTRLRAEVRPYGASGDSCITWEVTFFQPLSDGTQLIEVRIGTARLAELESPDLTLASANAAYATTTVAADTSYVFVGNADGTLWIVNDASHVNNTTGVFAYDITRSVRAQLLVEAEQPVVAISKAVFEEKPTEFFSALSFQGNATARTIETPNVYPAFIIQKAGTNYTYYTWFGASVWNRAGQTANINGGYPNAPKYASLGYPFDYTPATVAKGFTEYGFGYYKLGTDTNINASTLPGCSNIFAWVLGGDGAPKLNEAGLAKGGVSSWTVGSSWGFSTFSWVGVASADFNSATGLAVGHGLRDRDGNPLTPEIVFVKRYFYYSNLRNHVCIAGTILGTDLDAEQIWNSSWAGKTGNYFMKLAKKETSTNIGEDPAYFAVNTSSYDNLYAPKVADEDCIYLNSSGQGGVNSTMVGWAFASVPGSCKVGRITSAGMATQQVVTGFAARMVILKCITAKSVWLLFGQQECLETGGFQIHTNVVAFDTTTASVTFTASGFEWTNKLDDAGQEWLYIAVGAYGPQPQILAMATEPGAFGLSGMDAGNKRGISMPVDPGSFDAVGQGALLIGQQLVLMAATAAVNWQGFAAALTKSAVTLEAAEGALALNGSAAALQRTLIQPLNAGALALAINGQAAALNRGAADLVAEAGALALTLGQAALYRGAITPLASEAGSLLLGGQVASKLQTHALAAEAGSVLVSGQGSGDLQGQVLIAQAGAVVLAGEAAGSLQARVVHAEALSVVLAGQAASKIQTRLLVVVAGSIMLGGQDAENIQATLLPGEARSLVFTGQDAGKQQGRVAKGETGALAISGQEISKLQEHQLLAEAGSVQLIGIGAGNVQSLLQSGQTGSVVLDGQEAGKQQTHITTGEAAGLVLNGQDSQILSSRWLTGEAGSYLITGEGSGDMQSWRLNGEAGVIALSGQVAGQQRLQVTDGEAGSFAVDGQAAGLTWVIPPSPSASGDVLLLHMDGSNNSTTFADSSTYGRTVTPAGSTGTYITTAQAKFGGAAGYFMNAPYLWIADAAELAFGGGDFTIEGWLRLAQTVGSTSKMIASKAASGTSDFAWALWYTVSTPKNVGFSYSADGTNRTTITAEVTISTNTWVHLAVVRYGANLSIYANGVQIGTTHDIGTTAIHDSSANLLIGSGYAGAPNYFWYGYIDELRISKVAQYTAAFTAPTAAFPDPPAGLSMSADAGALEQQGQPAGLAKGAVIPADGADLALEGAAATLTAETVEPPAPEPESWSPWAAENYSWAAEIFPSGVVTYVVNPPASEQPAADYWGEWAEQNYSWEAETAPESWAS